jgi:type I restriction enzyme S subunit
LTENSDIPKGYKATELGMLPEEWDVKPLSEIISFRKGRKPNNLSETPANDAVPYLTADYFRTRVSSKYVNLSKDPSAILVATEDVVFIWDGSNAGDVFLGLNGVLASTMTVIRADQKKVLNNWIYYTLKTNFPTFNTQTTGSTIPHVNKNIFLNLPVPLPPLPEQHAIATTLRIAQEAKEKSDAVITATKALKIAMMKHLFTYGPVPPEDAERVVLKETEIGPVPEGWEISTLGKIAHVGNGSTPKRDNPPYWENGTIPWITSTRVHDSIITRADFFVTELATRECHLPLVKKGSLVIAITGQGKTLGNTSLVSFDTRVNQHLAYVKFNDDSVVAEFMLRFMQSRYQPLRDVSHSAGSTKGALTCGFLKTYPVPLPPNNVQTLIAETFSAIDQKLAAEQSRKEALDTLFTSLLHDLMTAKIRVVLS